MKLIRMVVFMMLCVTLVALGAEAAGEVVPIPKPPTDSVIPTWAVQAIGVIAAGMGTWVLWGVGRLVNLVFVIPNRVFRSPIRSSKAQNVSVQSRQTGCNWSGATIA